MSVPRVCPVVSQLPPSPSCSPIPGFYPRSSEFVSEPLLILTPSQRPKWPSASYFLKPKILCRIVHIYHFLRRCVSITNINNNKTSTFTFNNYTLWLLFYLLDHETLNWVPQKYNGNAKRANKYYCSNISDVWSSHAFLVTNYYKWLENNYALTMHSCEVLFFSKWRLKASWNGTRYTGFKLMWGRVPILNEL